jgi:hypothetical protein
VSSRDTTLVLDSLSKLPPEALAQAYRADGYRSISNKYRTIARLPPGKTGIEALSLVDPTLAEHLLAQAEERATEAYLRVHARAETGDVLVLEPDVFLAFKRAQNGDAE